MFRTDDASPSVGHLQDSAWLCFQLLTLTFMLRWTSWPARVNLQETELQMCGRGNFAPELPFTLWVFRLDVQWNAWQSWWAASCRSAQRHRAAASWLRAIRGRNAKYIFKDSNNTDYIPSANNTQQSHVIPSLLASYQLFETCRFTDDFLATKEKGTDENLTQLCFIGWMRAVYFWIFTSCSALLLFLFALYNLKSLSDILTHGDVQAPWQQGRNLDHFLALWKCALKPCEYQRNLSGRAPSSVHSPNNKAENAE